MNENQIGNGMILSSPHPFSARKKAKPVGTRGKMSRNSVVEITDMAVLTFEILLNSCALLNHANVRLPLHVDAILRLIVVTPDQHRVHHSTKPDEFNANYGFNFPWWDRIFGTYVPQPREGHTGMTIGLNIFRDPKYIRITRMLAIPFL